MTSPPDEPSRESSLPDDVPPDLAEPARLRALQRYDILDTPAEEAFDHIAELTAHLLDVPIAGIHFIDDTCQWAKAQAGMDAKTLRLDVSFCARELGEVEVLVVEDATKDERFHENPLVTGDPGIRFYAGATLTTPDGFALGRLCVIDTTPHPGGLSGRERETLKKLAEVVMHELEYRAQPRHREEVLESITDAFVAVDRDWCFTYVNERAAELLQRSRAALLGENVWGEFPEAVELAFYNHYHRAVETGEPAEFEAYFPPLETWFHVKAYPFEDGLSIYFDDITAQRKREKKLRLLSRAVDDAAESVVITGPEIDEPGPRIEYVNPAFEAMTGYTADEVIGKTPRILQGPRTDRAVLDVIRSHLKAGEPLTETTAINYRKDGTPFWAEWNLSPVRGPDGTIEHWVAVQRDVTEQRELRAALREREARFRLLFESNPLPMWVYDRDSLRFLAVNEAAIDHYGYSKEEFLAMTIIDIRPDEEVERLRKNLAAERPDLERSGSWKHRLKNGCVIDVDIASHILEFNDHEAVLVVARDITEQRAAQEKIRRQRNLLEQTQRLAGSWDINLESEALTWSDEVYRIHELEPGTEVELEDGINFYAPEARPVIREAVTRAIEEREPWDLELPFVTAKGNRRWVRVVGAPVIEGDEVVKVTGAFQDVTRRHEMEAELRRSEALFRNFSEQAVDVVALFDAEGTFKYLSPSIEHVTGYRRDELIGTDGFAPVHPDDLPALRRAFSEVIEHLGKTAEVEGRYRHKDGSWRHLSIRGRQLPTPSPEIEVLANVRDVTERKEREKELVRAKETAEEMSRLKSAFLANMSHEIRTPLTAIIGFADLLRETIEGPAAELLEMIRTSGHRLEETLTSVLDLAQLESGVMHLEVQTVDLASEIRAVANSFQHKAHDKGLALRVDVPASSIMIDTAPAALRRILSNLLSNAVKFTKEGYVRVALRLKKSPEVNSDGKPESEQVAITVEDTGIGIGPSNMDRVFAEFAQESEGYSRAYEGVGLGLAITRRLTQLLGGSIVIESVKNQGTTFTVTLPRQPTLSETPS